MEKRKSVSSEDISRVEREFQEITEIEGEITVSEPERVLVRNLIPSLVTWHSPKTGEDYLWGNSGSEVKVLKEDVDFLLAHRRKGCCGATSSPSFELVE